MSDLLDKFKENVSKMKTNGVNASAEFDVLYSTGFLSIDYLNGTVIHVEPRDQKKKPFKYNALGIVDGSTNTFIGRSGSGKSTLLIQISGNIVSQFDEAKLFIDDIEGGLPTVRKQFLLNMTPEEMSKKVDIRNSGITAENLYKRIQTIHDIKTTNRKDYEYDTGLYNTYGERIFKLVPTIYCIDSLPMLLPEALAEDEDLGGSMAASSIAKTNTMVLKKVSQLCKDANIILICINHINDDIQMGFIPKAAQISGLKQGERLPGGKAALYLANNLFRLDDKQTLKASEGFGIDGSLVELSIVKSRTNMNKRSVPLIFNKSEGRFDEILSLFQLLKSEGVFSGAGAYQYLDDCPDIKFSQKNFKSVLAESQELQQAFAKACYNVLSQYLSETRAIRNDTETQNVSLNISNMINSFGSIENSNE